MEILGPATPDEPRAAFYYDLASPEAYLASERVIGLLPIAAEWIPVTAAALPAADSLEGFRCATDLEAFRERIERTAQRRGLQHVRWPEPFPFDSALVLRAATYAKQIGRAVAFSLAAFRQAFAGGRDLSITDNVLIAAAACEMHPTAVLKAIQLRSVSSALSRATELAVQRGIRDVPALWLPDGRVFHGDAQLDTAAAALAPA